MAEIGFLCFFPTYFFQKKTWTILWSVGSPESRACILYIEFLLFLSLPPSLPPSLSLCRLFRMEDFFNHQCVLQFRLYITSLGIESPSENYNGTIQSLTAMLRRWLDTPIIIWEYPWMPRAYIEMLDRIHFSARCKTRELYPCRCHF